MQAKNQYCVKIQSLTGLLDGISTRKQVRSKDLDGRLTRCSNDELTIDIFEEPKLFFNYKCNLSFNIDKEYEILWQSMET